MGIDPETTCNSATKLGAVESCVRVDVPNPAFDGVSDYTIDVYVSGDVDPPISYDAWLTYDSDKVRVVPGPPTDPLIKMPGAMDFSDWNPSPPSDVVFGAIYLMPPDAGIPGDGTLVRIGLDIGDAGLATFDLYQVPGIVPSYASCQDPPACNDYPPHPITVMPAMLAINQDCPGTPPPADSDSDGVPNASDNCLCVHNPDQADTDSDGIGDVCGDGDADGFIDAIELYLGTDPVDSCPDNPSDDAWPPDKNMDTFVTVVGDILDYAGTMGKDVATYPELQRRDLNMDGYITVVGDVRIYQDRMGKSCT